MPDMGVAKHWRHIAIASLVSLVILVILCWKTGVRLGEVWDILRTANRSWLAAIFLFSAAVHIFLGTWKWQVIIHGIGCPVRYGEMLYVRVASEPICFALPLKIGDLSNVLYFSQSGRLPFCESASWTIFDKALNFLGTLFWLLVGLLIGGTAWDYKWPVIIAGGMLVVLLLIPRLARLPVRIASLLHHKLGEITGQLLVTFEKIRAWRRIGLILLSIVFQLRPLIVCYLLFIAIGPKYFASRPDVPELLAKGSVVVVASNVPGSQSGFGTREAALYALFRDHLLDPTKGAPLFSLGVLMAMAIFVVPAIIGLPFMASFVAAITARKKRAAVRDDVMAAPATDETAGQGNESPKKPDTSARPGGTG